MTVEYKQSTTDFENIDKVVEHTNKLISKLNFGYHDNEAVLKILSEVVGYEIDSSNEINLPFSSDYGPHIKLGKNIYVNRNCMFVDLGGITLEDGVLIGPDVKLLSVNHPLDPHRRHNVIGDPVLIKENAWIGAGAIVLPGITVGKNSVVGAGSVVTEDVPDNSVAVGNPARVIKKI
ncbi:DapH/DapD/GlmU-related protein [Companilactobacillus kedongensis]|uniref:DapH/DapD/GlmU-related protein n=1 Tax=Companilactobacillus kedongensis TaxID=2486004 RepID=UPI000F766310|nr:DapH/DapD/GlmU-related protein [Companilactobacillus kedongensis]